MKQIISLLFLLITASYVNAQLENTRWKATIVIENPVNVIFDFKKDTASIYTVADSTVIETMTYTSTDTSVTLSKIEGESECGNEPGKYKFTITNNMMLLTLISDDCYDRSSVVDSTKWTKWKDYPEVKIDESILKQYVGVYEMDPAHPITVSLEDGILYVEGPNNGLPKSPFTPVTETKFFLRIAAVEMDFIKDVNGKVVSIISHEAKDYELKKVK